MICFCEKASEYAPVLKATDQAPFALVMNEHNIKFKNFDGIYGHHPYESGWENAIILHSFSVGQKFWTNVKNKEWDQNNEKWIKMWKRK